MRPTRLSRIAPALLALGVMGGAARGAFAQAVPRSAPNDTTPAEPVASARFVPQIGIFGGDLGAGAGLDMGSSLRIGANALLASGGFIADLAALYSLGRGTGPYIGFGIGLAAGGDTGARTWCPASGPTCRWGPGSI
jgi:hypothetical protein